MNGIHKPTCHKLMAVVLTSHREDKARRLVRSLKAQAPHDFQVDIWVVCNTLDESYPEKAMKMATREGCMYARTESNGKPGKGKNSALNLFRAQYNAGKAYDYLLLLDGDDFLYPHALAVLSRALYVSRADIVGLQTNDILDTRKFKMSGVTLQRADGVPVHLYSWFNEQPNLYARADQFNKARRDRNPLGVHSTPDRVILMSALAVLSRNGRGEYALQCSEELPVYEDYLLSLSAQAAMLRPGSQLRYVNLSNSYVYVYDKTGDSSTCKEYEKECKGDWGLHQDLFEQEIDNMGLRLYVENFHPAEVPFVYVPGLGGIETVDALGDGVSYKVEHCARNLLP